MIYLKMNGVTLVWRTCSRLVENHIFFNVDIFIFIYCSSIVTKRQSNPILVMNDNSRKLCITQLDLEEEYRDQRTLFPLGHLICRDFISFLWSCRRQEMFSDVYLLHWIMCWRLCLCSGSYVCVQDRDEKFFDLSDWRPLWNSRSGGRCCGHELFCFWIE